MLGFYTILRRAVLSTALALALVAGVPCSAADQVVSTLLPSGLKVIVREGHVVNLVAVDIWVRAGTATETTANSGISHLVEHMIFKGTKKYGPGQADREIEGLGAELNGGTSRDYVHFYTTVASEYLPKALDVLADAITNAQFRPEEIEKERGVLSDEIARVDSDPVRRALNLFARTAYAGHPYGLPATGLKDSINGLSRDALLAYYAKYYTPGNTVVSVAGDVSAPDAVALVGKAFEGYKGAAAMQTALQDVTPITTPRTAVADSPDDKTHIVFGYLGPPISRFTDSCALDVVLALFGDSYGGRIASALNARGIAFGELQTDYMFLRGTTTFSTLVSVDPKDEDAAVEVIKSEYLRVAGDAVPDGELEQAKRTAVGGDLFDQETFSGQARALGLYESIGSYDLALKYGTTVSGIKGADVQDAAHRYFGAGNYCLVKLKPVGKGTPK